jgi:hypothetical protein
VPAEYRAPLRKNRSPPPGISPDPRAVTWRQAVADRRPRPRGPRGIAACSRAASSRGPGSGRASELEPPRGPPRGEVAGCRMTRAALARPASRRQAGRARPPRPSAWVAARAPHGPRSGYRVAAARRDRRPAAAAWAPARQDYQSGAHAGARARRVARARAAWVWYRAARAAVADRVARSVARVSGCVVRPWFGSLPWFTYTAGETPTPVQNRRRETRSNNRRRANRSGGDPRR